MLRHYDDLDVASDISINSSSSLIMERERERETGVVGLKISFT